MLKPIIRERVLEDPKDEYISREQADRVYDISHDEIAMLMCHVNKWAGDVIAKSLD